MIIATFSNPRSNRIGNAPYGGTLIELLIGCLIALLTGAALVSLQQSSYVANSTVLGQNYANASSRRPLDVLGDTLRNAQAFGAGQGQVIASASASDVTCYTTSSGSMSRIWLDTSAHTLRRQKTDSDGSAAAVETLVSNVQSLQITYYMPAGNTYNASVASWTTTADPNAPSGAELPGVGAVNIIATISADGETRTLQNFIRMRNSPNTHDS